MDKIIIQTAQLNITAEEAFRMFTDNTLLESWLTAKADVEPHAGGKYELFWEPNDPENNSTIGCKVLAVDAPRFINFEWKGPKQYKHFMNNVRPLTNVTVTFIPDGDRVQVTLIHTGWRNTPEWDEARRYFENAWRGAFEQLQRVVSNGL
ncbi:MAG: SRPBCC domain-containing protein [Balneolaceae bacterium]